MYDEKFINTCHSDINSAQTLSPTAYGQVSAPLAHYESQYESKPGDKSSFTAKQQRGNQMRQVTDSSVLSRYMEFPEWVNFGNDLDITGFL